MGRGQHHPSREGQDSQTRPRESISMSDRSAVPSTERGDCRMTLQGQAGLQGAWKAEAL